MSIDEIIKDYDAGTRVLDLEAKEKQDRSYGGYVRETKGHLQEYITEKIVRLAWDTLGGSPEKLEINSKKIRIPIQNSYIERIKEKLVRDYIMEHRKDYYYGLSVDKHVFIDGKFVMGLECKAYTENAMIKRILVDFHLLKTIYPDISCHLFQLESELGGDYSALPKVVYGSKSTHAIMSYFPDVDLHITTLLRGERDINSPIHKNYKTLETREVEKAVKFIASFLEKYR